MASTNVRYQQWSWWQDKFKEVNLYNFESWIQSEFGGISTITDEVRRFLGLSFVRAYWQNSTDPDFEPYILDPCCFAKRAIAGFEQCDCTSSNCDNYNICAQHIDPDSIVIADVNKDIDDMYEAKYAALPAIWKE